MPTPFDQLLDQLKAAQGDTGKLALVTFDFAVAGDPVLKTAAEAAAIPHWFDGKTLSALLPEYADLAGSLLDRIKTLPMVEPYVRGNGELAWNIHEATRLALRDRLLATDSGRFKALSQRAATVYGSADPDAFDFVLTCEHLYHRLAGQTDAGDATMEWVAGTWRGDHRIELLQTLARLLDELLAAKPAPPLLPRGRGLAYQAIADARKNHQPAPTTHALATKAEAIFRELAASDPANAAWQRDLSVSLDKLGQFAVVQGDLAGALRSFTESKSICERLATSDPANVERQRDLSVSFNFLGNVESAQGNLDEAKSHYTEYKAIAERLAAADPANAVWQRDLWMSNGKLGDLASDQGNLLEALRFWTAANGITQCLAASDPANTAWQRDLSVSLERLGALAVAKGDLSEALRVLTESKTIAERLAASDPANAAWQRDLSVSLERLGDLALAQGDLAGALRSFAETKAIRDRLVASDPANAAWQRDLFFSCYLMAAKVFMPQEHWAEALALMEQSLTISERLAATDSTNVMWQKDVQVIRRLVVELRGKVAGK